MKRSHESWLMPDAAGPGVLRQGLRVHGGEPGAGEDGPGSVLRIDPRDGAVCVFRDTPVVAHFSRPLDTASLGSDSFRVLDDQGPLAGELRLSPDGRVLIWEARRALAPRVHHFVMASGLRDARGREVSVHLSRFFTCELMRKDISG